MKLVACMRLLGLSRPFSGGFIYSYIIIITQRLRNFFRSHTVNRLYATVRTLPGHTLMIKAPISVGNLTRQAVTYASGIPITVFDLIQGHHQH